MAQAWVDLLSLLPTQGTDSKQHTRENSLAQNLLAVFDHELFAFVDENVRIWNLHTLKQTEDPSKYTTLRFDKLEFNPCGISVNSNGTWLALFGEGQVTVVALPDASRRQRCVSGDPIVCKCISIGTFLPASGILKVAWHPLSESSCHLAVLAENKTFCLYHVIRNPDEPEQQYDLLQLKPAKPARLSSGHFGDPDEDEDEKVYSDAEIVSFTFGTGEDGWQPFTIFFLRRDGGVCAFSPVLPRNSLLHVDHLRRLLTETPRNADSRSDSNSSSAQARWLSSLLCHPSGHSSLLSVRSEPALALSKPLLQNPLKIQPPLPFGASDIAFVAGSPAVLLVSFTNGTVYQLIQVKEPEAMWQHDEPSSQDKNRVDLVVVDAVDLGLGASNETRTVRLMLDLSGTPAGSVSIPTIFATHDKGAHAITLPWYKDLQNNTEMKNWASEVVPLVDTMPTAASKPCLLVGAVVVRDRLLGRVFIGLTPQRQLIGVTLQQQFDYETQLQSLSLETPSSSPQKPNRTPFEKTIRELLPNDADLPAKPRVVTSSVTTEAELLELLVANTQASHEKQIKPNLLLAAEIRAKVAQLTLIEERQITQVGDLLLQVEELENKSKTLNERLAHSQKQHLKLRKRAESLLQIGIDLLHMDITEAEAKYHKDLQDKQKSIRDYSLRLKKIQSQFSILEKRLPSTRAVLPNLSAQYEATVRSLLAQDSRLLTEAVERVQVLQQTLQQL